MNLTQNITIGADPELFLVEIGNEDALVSGVGIIGGSKEMPLDIGNGCAIQEDNVAAEFCIPPARVVDDFIKSIQYNLDHIKNKVKPFGLELSIRPSGVFPDEELRTPGAKTFGCDPDFNAWNGGEANPRPKADNANLRSAGGHVHVGLPDELKSKRLDVVKAMDLFIGCQMLAFDTDTDRRQLYGKAGAHRIKPYGVEYRTPSNAWIKSEKTIRWMWAQVDKAVKFVADGNTLTEQDGEMIQECINNSNQDMLKVLNEKFGIGE